MKKGKRMSKKLLSVMLAAAISLTLLPASVLAAGPKEVSEARFVGVAEDVPEEAGTALLEEEDAGEGFAEEEVLEREDFQLRDISSSARVIENTYTLAGDETISGDLIVDADMDLNGYTLTVTGSLWHKSGTINFGSGELAVEEDYELRGNSNGTDYSGNPQWYNSSGTFEMDNTNAKLTVGGNIYAQSAYASTLNGGTLEFRGNVTDVSGNTFKGTAWARFTGTEAQTVDLRNSSACFQNVVASNDNVRFVKL
ncbi:MAG: hypothetical protein IJU50_03925, partial [Lachnospiraceae bacterium]|nr:hypothetical protein [Lachnospiraceae bacterium]